jgi:hypothetical protein
MKKVMQYKYFILIKPWKMNVRTGSYVKSDEKIWQLSSYSSLAYVTRLVNKCGTEAETGEKYLQRTAIITQRDE